ncbi:MAG TPA: cell division protein FtsL, partial [Candidatus Polarisedimenticolia bacterium]|nr:cell division protein FtsL [Candidatus Polarisedimenticolia bacterium]
LMLMPLLLYVWQNTEWIRAGYRVEKLKTQRIRLEEINHKLRLEKASLESLARVEAVAVRQLDLAQPPAGTVVLVDTGRTQPERRDRPGAIAAAQAASSAREREKPVEDASAN